MNSKVLALALAVVLLPVALFANSKTGASLDLTQTLPIDISGTTPYNALAMMFEKASPATFKDVLGWKVGRLFDSTGGEQALISIFHHEKLPGGLLTDTDILGESAWQSGPTFYDEMSTETIYKLRTNGGFSSSYKETQTGLAENFPDGTNEYRVFKGYLIEKLHSGEYGYYFKNLTPGDGGLWAK